MKKLKKGLKSARGKRGSFAAASRFQQSLHKKPGRRKLGGGRGRWVIGGHAVKEALKVRPEAVVEIFFREGGGGPADSVQEEMEAQAKSLTIPVEKVSGQQLDRLGSGHQGVACRVIETPELDWDSLADRKTSLIIVLDGIEDPHNLGAILRTAWLMGADGILTSSVRSVKLTPGVSKVASGGVEHLPVDIYTNLPRALILLKEKGFWVYGLEEESSNTLWQTNFAEKVALVVGSEGHGLRTSVRGQCDQFVGISQKQKGASYNASVAASLAMAEFFRQLQTP